MYRQTFLTTGSPFGRGSASQAGIQAGFMGVVLEDALAFGHISVAISGIAQVAAISILLGILLPPRWRSSRGSPRILPLVCISQQARRRIHSYDDGRIAVILMIFSRTGKTQSLQLQIKPRNCPNTSPVSEVRLWFGTGPAPRWHQRFGTNPAPRWYSRGAELTPQRKSRPNKGNFGDCLNGSLKSNGMP